MSYQTAYVHGKAIRYHSFSACSRLCVGLGEAWYIFLDWSKRRCVYLRGVDHTTALQYVQAICDQYKAGKYGNYKKHADLALDILKDGKYYVSGLGTRTEVYWVE